MKKYIRATKYDSRMVWSHGNQRFSVHMNDCNEDNPLCVFQVSEIHPYDDADYAWAACDGRTVNYYRNNRKIASKPVIPYDPEDYEEYREYIDELVDSVCMTLREYNRDVEPRMIHN